MKGKKVRKVREVWEVWEVFMGGGIRYGGMDD